MPATLLAQLQSLPPDDLARLRSRLAAGDAQVASLAQAAIDEACRDDPIAFAYSWASWTGIAELPAAHHELFLNAAAALARDELDAVLIASPPGSAKTRYCAHVVPTWWLARNPRSQILLVTHTDSLAARHGRMIRNVAALPQWQRLAGTALAGDSQAADRFDTELGGGLYCAGTGAAIFGQRADLIICDDLIRSLEDAASSSQMMKLHDWITAELLIRLKPRGKLLSICQRLTLNDAHGFLLKVLTTQGLRVREIRLPAISEGADDPLNRPPGVALWPEHLGAAHFTRYQTDPVQWNTLFQQRPILGEGAWCPFDCIQYHDAPPSGCAYYIGIDFATGAQRGDYTALALVGVLRAERGEPRFYVERMIRARIAPHEAIEELITIARDFDVREIYIDKDFFFATLKGPLTERLRARGRAVPVRAIPMQSKDKETRAAALQVALRREQVSIRRGASWSAALVDELLSFPLALGAGVDDQVDALGLVARSVTRLGGRLPEMPRLRVYNLLDPRNPNAPPRSVTLRESAPTTGSPTPYGDMVDSDAFEHADARQWAELPGTLARTASTAAPKHPGETDAQYFERRRFVALEERMSDGRGALIALGGVLYARLPDLRRGALDDAWSLPEARDGDFCG